MLLLEFLQKCKENAKMCTALTVPLFLNGTPNTSSNCAFSVQCKTRLAQCQSLVLCVFLERNDPQMNGDGIAPKILLEKCHSSNTQVCRGPKKYHTM